MTKFIMFNSIVFIILRLTDIYYTIIENPNHHRHTTITYAEDFNFDNLENSFRLFFLFNPTIQFNLFYKYNRKFRDRFDDLKSLCSKPKCLF